MNIAYRLLPSCNNQRMLQTMNIAYGWYPTCNKQNGYCYTVHELYWHNNRAAPDSAKVCVFPQLRSLKSNQTSHLVEVMFKVLNGHYYSLLGLKHSYTNIVVPVPWLSSGFVLLRILLPTFSGVCLLSSCSIIRCVLCISQDTDFICMTYYSVHRTY